MTPDREQIRRDAETLRGRGYVEIANRIHALLAELEQAERSLAMAQGAHNRERERAEQAEREGDEAREVLRVIATTNWPDRVQGIAKKALGMP